MEEGKREHATINLFEIAAIKFVSGVEPDRYLVERNSRLGVAVYADKSKLPPKSDIQKFLDFSMQYMAVKRHVFALVDETIEKGENNNVGTQTH
ncbi:MAG: hypothetical protein PHX83_12045 [Acidobacteriia bacterium]|nr:hypothetical protein [Terriglobia bacterium]